jgi:hypothetical protein
MSWFVCIILIQLAGLWDFHDGIGAAQLQTASGKSAADLANINNGALSMAYPLAKTVAIKDACDHFGTTFGSDLNRKDTIAFTSDDKLHYGCAKQRGGSDAKANRKGTRQRNSGNIKNSFNRKLTKSI